MWPAMAKQGKPWRAMARQGKPWRAMLLLLLLLLLLLFFDIRFMAAMAALACLEPYIKMAALAKRGPFPLQVGEITEEQKKQVYKDTRRRA